MADLVVLAFADETVANRALDELQRLQREEQALTVRDWALVVREADEHLTWVRSSDTAPASGRTAVRGGIMGTIIGGLLLAPLAGLMVGTLIGATISRRRETGVDPDFARELSAALQPGTAALFLYVVATDADRVIERLTPFAPRVLRTSLTSEDEGALRARLEGVAAQDAGGAGSAAPAGLLNRSFGRWYPTDFVVALIDDAAQAASAAAALEEAGFPQGEIAFRESEQVLEQIEAFRSQEGRLGRAAGKLHEQVASEGQLGRRFREAAGRGAAVIAVRAETPEWVEAAGRVLREQGGHDIHHFGRWAIADLSAGG